MVSAAMISAVSSRPRPEPPTSSGLEEPPENSWKMMRNGFCITLASTFSVRLSPWIIWPASAWATGASLTEVTCKVSVTVASSWPSLTV